MFRVKICGVTNLTDAEAAAAAGADALGLNFFRGSKRFIGDDAARQIVERVPKSVAKVCVFVNHDAREIYGIASGLNLDFVQLHGDEPAELLAELQTSVRIVRAYRVGADGLAPLASYLADCRSLGRMPDAVLLDSQVAGAFGGTGHTVDWSRVARERSSIGDVPVILAGGLTAENVADAIAAVRPDAVDVASGVESRPGVKNADLMRRFILAARDAFARCE
jgi:phosphoribosylanthranilate isomerase